MKIIKKSNLGLSTVIFGLFLSSNFGGRGSVDSRQNIKGVNEHQVTRSEPVIVKRRLYTLIQRINSNEAKDHIINNEHYNKAKY